MGLRRSDEQVVDEFLQLYCLDEDRPDDTVGEGKRNNMSYMAYITSIIISIGMSGYATNNEHYGWAIVFILVFFFLLNEKKRLSNVKEKTNGNNHI